MPGIDKPSAPPLALRLLPILFWIALAGGGLLLLTQYLDSKEQETRANWQEQLKLVAQLQVQQADDWLNTRRGTLSAISENMSARLYLQTLRQPAAESELPEALRNLPGMAGMQTTRPEQTFLQNYLVTMAQQGGFTLPPQASDAIKANVNGVGSAGLAIVDEEGQLIVSTGSLPALEPILAEFAAPATPEGGVRVSRPLNGANGEPVLAWMAPMAGVQDETTPLGYIVGVAPAEGLYRLVSRQLGGEVAASSQLAMKAIDGEWLLIQPETGSAPFTPLQEDSVELAALTAPGQLREGYGLQHIAALDVAAINEQGRWAVVRSVPRDIALGDLAEQGVGLMAAFILALLTVTLAVMLLWRHLSAQQTSRLMTDIYAHRSLLQLVTDRLPAKLFIIDGAERFAYANARAAEAVDSAPGSMTGKTLEAVMGNARAVPYREEALKAMQGGLPSATWHEWKENGQLHAREIEAVPLDRLPGQGGKSQPHALVIEQDFTDMVQARQAQQQSLDKLLDMLVMLVDQRDPNAARQSAGVALISRRIAQAMELDRLQVETAETAGRLRNLGKLLVPQDVLVSALPLAKEDKKLFDTAFDSLLQYLGNVPFNGPVVETLRQSKERVDGKGPQHVAGDDLLPTAKVVAVANSFVALTSPRAYRSGLDADAALEELRKEGGALYAKQVVTALEHYLANQDGRAEWDIWRREPQAA